MTDLAPRLVSLNGWPAWQMPDGSLRPHVSGGIDEGGGGDGSGGAGEGGSGEGTAPAGSASTTTEAPPALTPEQEALVESRATERAQASFAKRLEAERKKWEQEAKQATDRAKMEESDRLKAEKADADQRATDAATRANSRLVAADAKIAALDAQVPKDRLAAFMKLADLSDVAVDDDGNVDEKALAKAVKATLDAHSFLVSAGNGAGKSGAEFNDTGGPKKVWTRDEIARLAKVPADFAKHEADIDAAMREGRISA